MIKANYHCHTTRCGHAYGKDEEYVINAVKAGFKIFGFSDHTPWQLLPYESDFYRMDIKLLPDYLASVNKLKEEYKDEIKIYLGLEAEYYPERIDWLKQLREDSLDYLVLGNHYHNYTAMDTYYGGFYNDKDKMMTWYLDDSYEALKSGLYDIFAHPDLFLCNYDHIDKTADDALEKLCLWSKEFNVPLEYNLAGLGAYRNYPNDKFFMKAAKHQSPVIVGGDYHNPEAVLNNRIYENSRKRLKDWGCLVVDTINIKTQ